MNVGIFISINNHQTSYTWVYFLVVGNTVSIDQILKAFSKLVVTIKSWGIFFRCHTVKNRRNGSTTFFLKI